MLAVEAPIACPWTARSSLLSVALNIGFSIVPLTCPRAASVPVRGYDSRWRIGMSPGMVRWVASRVPWIWRRASDIRPWPENVAPPGSDTWSSSSANTFSVWFPASATRKAE